MTHRKADTFTFSNKASFSPTRGGVETQKPHFCLKSLLSCSVLTLLWKCSITWTGWASGQSKKLKRKLPMFGWHLIFRPLVILVLTMQWQFYHGTNSL